MPLLEFSCEQNTFRPLARTLDSCSCADTTEPPYYYSKSSKAAAGAISRSAKPITHCYITPSLIENGGTSFFFVSSFLHSINIDHGNKLQNPFPRTAAKHKPTETYIAKDQSANVGWSDATPQHLNRHNHTPQLQVNHKSNCFPRAGYFSADCSEMQGQNYGGL